MRWLWPDFVPLLPRLVGNEAVLIAGVASSLAASVVMGLAVDAAMQQGTVAELLTFGAAYMGLVGLGAALTWLARVRMEAIAQQVMLAVKQRLFRHLVRHDIALHDNHGPGALLARVSGDTEAMRLFLSEVILQLPGDLGLAVGMFIVLGVTAPSLAWVMAASLPVWILLIVGYRRVSPAAFAEVRAQATSLSGWMAESIAALPLLRTMDRLSFATDHTAALGRARFAAELRYGMQSVWFFNALFGVRSVLLAAVVWLGAVQVADGLITAGVLLIAVDYVRKLIEPFLRLQFHITTLERARVGAARIKTLLDTPAVVRDLPSPRPWSGVGDIVLDSVGFGYGPTPIFSALSLVIPKGAHVALVGPTGGGKSTLVQLIARLRDPDAGAVRFAGVDLRELSLYDVRGSIGMVSQSVQVLPGTVAENLGETDVEKVAALLAEVGLSHRLRPDTLLGPGGQPLSHGEAQLLCVARALAGDPEVLVLDEATSAMDPETEARIQATFAARPGRTRITVAHRLRTVVDADQIVVVNRGIVEHGTHAALVARGGVYASLWAAQRAREG